MKELLCNLFVGCSENAIRPLTLTFFFVNRWDFLTFELNQDVQECAFFPPKGSHYRKYIFFNGLLGLYAGSDRRFFRVPERLVQGVPVIRKKILCPSDMLELAQI